MIFMALKFRLMAMEAATSLLDLSCHAARRPQLPSVDPQLHRICFSFFKIFSHFVSKIVQKCRTGMCSCAQTVCSKLYKTVQLECVQTVCSKLYKTVQLECVQNISPLCVQNCTKLCNWNVFKTATQLSTICLHAPARCHPTQNHNI